MAEGGRVDKGVESGADGDGDVRGRVVREELGERAVDGRRSHREPGEGAEVGRSLLGGGRINAARLR